MIQHNGLLTDICEMGTKYRYNDIWATNEMKLNDHDKVPTSTKKGKMLV